MKNPLGSFINKGTPTKSAKITKTRQIIPDIVMYSRKAAFSYPTGRREDLYNIPGRTI